MIVTKCYNNVIYVCNCLLIRCIYSMEVPTRGECYHGISCNRRNHSFKNEIHKLLPSLYQTFWMCLKIHEIQSSHASALDRWRKHIAVFGLPICLSRCQNMDGHSKTSVFDESEFLPWLVLTIGSPQSRIIFIWNVGQMVEKL